MSRARRFLLVFLSGLLLCVCLALVVTRVFLASERFTREVADRLEATLLAPTSLGKAEVGGNKIRVHDLRVYEVGSEESPWLTVAEAEGQATPYGLVTGRALPREFTLRGASLVLRFDRAGQLLTRLPKKHDGSSELPHLRVRGGMLTIQQEGRPDFTLHDLNLDLESENGQLTLKGQFNDPAWGPNLVAGAWTPAEQRAHLTLKSTDKINVTRAMLLSIPFVSARVWEEVQVEGITPLEMELDLGSNAGKLRFDARLAPEATTLHVAVLDLDVQQVQGKLRIVDEVVSFDGFGQAAKGEIKVDTRLDFQATPSHLTFKVQAQQLDLERLPAHWGLPQQLKGRLSGKANLDVYLEAKGPRTSGQGEGLITDAKLGDIPVAEPIRLTLHSDGSRFRFATPPQQSSGALLPPAFTIALVAHVGPGEAPFPPTEAVNWLDRSLRGLVQAVVQQGRQALAQLPQAGKKPPAPKAADSLLEANLRLDQVEVEQLARTTGVAMPFPVKGKVSVAVKVGIPLNTSRDLKAYRLEGKASSKHLDLASLELEQLESQFHYREGVLQLEQVRARMPGAAETAAGTLAGTARVELVPAGDVSARLVVRDLPLPQLAKLISLPPGQFAGGVSAAVSVRAPAERLKDSAAWQGDGFLAAEILRAYGWSVQRLNGVARLRAGTFSLPQVTAELESTPVTGSADVKLEANYPYHAHLQVRRADLAALQRLAPEVRPPFAVEGQLEAEASVQGTLRPLRYEARGVAKSSQLKLAEFKVNRATVNWETDGESLRIKSLQGNLYQGEVTGTAQIPLRDAGKGEVDLRVKDVELAPMSKDARLIPFQLDGRIEKGTLTATIPSRADGERAWTAKSDLQAPRLRIQGIPAEHLQATASYRKGVVDYHLEGGTLGGRFELEGKVPAGQAKPTSGPEARLRVDSAQLGRLARALRMPALEPLHGRVDLNVTLEPQKPGRPATGTGRFTLTRLRWGQVELSPLLSSPVRLTENELLWDLSGIFADGVLRGVFALNFRQPERSYFTLDLERLEAAKLLAPWPDAAAVIQGPIDARVRGRLGSEWSGSAEIVLPHGKLVGIEVTEWRLPLSWTFTPSAPHAQIDIREATAQLARGRALARVSLGLGTGSRVEGQVRFFNVDLQTALRQSAELAAAGSGQLSGRLDLAGQDMRTIQDLGAVLDATLTKNQALELPVLQQIAPFILPGQSAATQFNSGHVRARLTRGLIRIQQLTLEGDAGRVWVDGTVTLQGRLNLNVLAATGALGASPAVLRRLGLRIPLTGATPVGWLLEARTYLANRSVYLHVTGTVRSPTIQIEPLSLLADQTLRYFLNRSSLPLP